MSSRTKLSSLTLLVIFLIIPIVNLSAAIQDSVTLYTPYTKIAVPPGESIDYTIDIINNSHSVKTVDVTLSGLPKGWTYDLKFGAWKIGQVSVLPNEKKSLSLKVVVPYKINKGAYHFKFVAGESNALPLTVTISEQGTYKTEFTTPQPNMQGHASSNFTFNGTIQNLTAEKQNYALVANAPVGWNVTFRSNIQQVASISVDPLTTQPVIIDIKPAEGVEAGKYLVPVSAITSTTTARLDLEVVITGSYSFALTTPTGLLSTDITAGDIKRVELLIKNTGSSELKNINFEFNAPVNWDVTFDPKSILSLPAGKNVTVYATVKADKKAIPGDYMTDIQAKTPETSAKASFRISVETPLLWGWVGVLIIVAAIGSVYYLFRKYGRR
jgi:uncharacterized membrane protein